MLLGYVHYALTDEGFVAERRLAVASNVFNLDSIDDQDCLVRFRFCKADIRRVVSLVQMPEEQGLILRRRYRTYAVFSF